MPRSAFIAFAALLALLTTSSAVAGGGGGPSIVGTYAVQIVTYCPPTLDLAGGKLSASGDLEKQLLTMTFMNTGTFTASGFADLGSPVLVTNNTYHAGVVLNEISQSYSHPYSNTATTLTLAPATIVFHVLYNNVNAAGQAGGFMWMGIYPNGAGGECSQTANAVRQ